MVEGLHLFAARFKGLEDGYVLIGGAACDLWLGEQGLNFRSTKDLDVVLLVDQLTTEFFRRFWDFIRDGKYESHQNRDARPSFYRFMGPRTPGFPFMIELLSRNQLNIPAEFRFTPVPAGDDLSSLSAILLDEEYYRYILDSRLNIEGLPTIPARCLIPMKARAHLDLVARKAAGESVRGTDVKKHRYDVFRLYLALAPADRFELPPRLRDDLVQFLDALPPESPDWEAIGHAVGKTRLPPPEQVLQQMRNIFHLAAPDNPVRPENPVNPVKLPSLQ
jgi:hypothetical protein